MKRTKRQELDPVVLPSQLLPPLGGTAVSDPALRPARGKSTR